MRPGQTVSWPFPEVEKTSISVKTRFSTMYSLKSTLNGIFKLGASVGIVSNNTQAILEVPLVIGEGISTNSQTHLSFTNTGKTDVMLRPRRDIELLVPYDSFLENSIRASVEVLSLAGLLAAFGLFLSAALSRPVSLFTASVLLAASLMAPDAVSQFPDEFNATIGERLGLAISRVVVLLTSAVSDMSPVSDLATGKAIVYKDMVHAIAYNLVLFPAILLALTAFVLRRKTK